MANKYTFNFDFTGKTDSLEKSLNDLQTKFKSLQLPNNIGDNLKKKIEQASDALDNFKNISNKKTFNDSDVRKINQGYEKLTDLLEDIGLNYQKLKNVKDIQLLPQAQLDKFKGLKKSLNDVISLQEKYTKAVKDYNDARKDIKNSGYAEAFKGIKKRLGLASNARESTVLPKVNTLLTEFKGRKKLTPEETDLKNQLRAFDDLYKKQKGLNDQLDKTEEALKKVLGVDSLSKVIPKFEDIEAVKTFRKELQNILGIDLSSASLDELKKQLDNLPKEKADEVRKKIADLGGSLKNIDPAAKEAEEAIRGFNNEGEHSKEVAGEIENLSSRFKQFFSITSGFYLLRNAVRSAYTAVQELDAVMTETAVVTDFTVGDMWKQLPQYTKVANELGVATKDVYKSATLYYQQGLNQQQVEQLNIATLKLARIASLDAAEATDRMTNALRGFNMELNETNANRIADVYSKLAAITAADVDEISTAMTKTASIASSAGMQFETTAAFLSQIIETTRESAETAGTAMKTVIARFQELKKAPDEIGEVDGEIVDANKVEGALRTVGISLRDASGQFRELDEVFLELSSKWNSLDKNTQRYIATIAAGSRQQSRFIAMMQNYDHTMELVNAANNAAGASQKQYEKTLESLESKLARLKNAWNEFALTLANSDLIKGTVDALNWLLTTVNKLTGDSELAKLGVLVGTFGGGKALASRLFGKKGATERTALSIGKKLGTQLATGIKSGVSSTGISLISALVPKTGDELADEFNRSIVPTINKGIIPNLLAIIGLRTKNLKLAEGEFLEQGKINAAVAAGKTVLLGYVGVAAAVAAALFIIYKTWKDNTPEEKLKKQQELTKKISENLTKDKEELDGLKNSIEQINEKSSAFDNLILGTKEWNETLLESNNLILDLIEKFPELAKGITRQNGRLILDENVVEKLIKSTEQNIKERDVLSYLDTINEHRLEQDVTRASFGNRFTVNGQNYVEEIAKAVASGRVLNISDLLRVNEEEGWNLSATTIVQFYEALEESTSRLREFGQELMSEDIKDLQAGELENKIINSLDFSEDSKEVLRNLLPDSFVQEQITKLNDEVVKEWESSISAQEDMIQRYATSRWGNGAKATDDKIYDKDGNLLEKVNDKIVQAYLSEAKNLEDFTKKLEELNASIPNLKNVKLLTQGASGVKYNDEIPGWVQAWTDNKDVLSSIGITENIFREYYNSLYREALQTKEKVKPLIKELGEEFSGYSLDLLNGLSDKIKEIRIRSGAESATKVLELLKESGLPEEVLTELNKIDWSDKSQLKNFSKTLKDLGVQVDNVAIDTLTNQIIQLNKASYNLNLEQLTEKMTGFASSIETIKSKIENGVKTFTKEEYDQLIAKGVDESSFIMTGADQFTYGGEIVDLLDIINKNLVDFFGDYKNGLEERVAQGKAIDGLSSIQKEVLFALNQGDIDLAQKKAQESEQDYDYFLRRIADDVGVDSTLDLPLLEEALGRAFENYGFEGLTYQQNKNQLNNQLTKQAQLTYSEQNSGQEMLKISSQIGDEKALQGALDAEIESKNLSVILQKLRDDTSKWTKEVKVSDVVLKAHAKDIYDAEQKWKKYQESVSEVEETLEDFDEKDINDLQALQTLGDQFENITGVKLEPEELIKYRKELIALGKGGKEAEEAFQILSEVIQKHFTPDLEKAGIIANDVKQIINNLNNSEFWVDGHLDISEFLANTDIAANKISKLLPLIEALGFTMNFKTEKVWIDENGNLLMPGMDKPSGATEVEYITGTIITRNEGYRTPRISSGGGGGGKSSKKENNNNWENPYNILYNHIEHVNELLRERNKIEFEYNKLIRDNSDAVQVEAGLYKEVLANLEEQRKEQQYIYNQAKEGYREQLKDIPYDKYLEEIEDAAVKAAGKARIQQLAGYDFEKNQVYIDWSGIADYEQELKAGGLSDDESKILNALTSVTDYLKDTESNMDAAEDALMEIENTIYDIQQNLREAYIEFEDRVITAIENIRQQEIDNQKQTNEALDGAASDLLNSIRSNIDKMRQDRANENTEEELARKERRLAYLRMDTSGSHNTEIAKLEKELRESQLDYADTLVDQSLQEMQDQNDAAAEQRERQITLMEDQLEWDKENAVIAHQAAKVIEDSRNEGYITESSPLYEILYNGEGWGSKSVASLENTLKAVQEGFSKAIVAINEGLVDPYYGDFSTEIDRQINRMLKALEDGDATLADSIAANIVRLNSARNAKIDQEGLEWKKYNSQELIAAAKNGSYSSSWWNVKSSTSGNGQGGKSGGRSGSNTTRTAKNGQSYVGDVDLEENVKNGKESLSDLTDAYNHASSDEERLEIARLTRQVEEATDDYVGMSGSGQKTGGSIADTMERLVKEDDARWINKNSAPQWYKYASGGLANFTGPAWLDGTPSKPEVVLNARDSENLIQLRDILRNNQNSGTNIGDSYFDIDINVDEIAGDYDVDRMVDRIKQIIYNDSTRNQVYIPR